MPSCNGREQIYIFDYVFIDVSDGVTKASKLEHVVERFNLELKQDQDTMIIHSRELVEKIKADRVALFPWRTTVLLIPPELASTVNIRGKNLERESLLLHGILDHYFNDDGQLVLFLNW